MNNVKNGNITGIDTTISEGDAAKIKPKETLQLNYSGMAQFDKKIIK